MPDDVRAGEDRLNRTILALIVVTVALNVVYLGALMLPGDPAPVLIDVWMSIIVQWVPVAVFWLVAVRTRFARWEVVLAAAAVTANAAGDTFYSLAMGASGELPLPSLADVGYLLYYPLLLAALLVLVRRRSRSSIRSVLFDGAVASLGAAAVLVVVLSPVFVDAASDSTLMGAATAAMYPLFDVLLISAVVGVFASPALHIGPRWQFLMIGFILFTGADIAYALLTHAGTYSVGTPLDAAWTAGVACAAIWVAGVTRDEPPAPPTVARVRMLPVPAFAVLAGLGVLLFATQHEVPVAALVLAAATVVLAAVTVLFRQAALARLLEGQELLVRELKKLDQSKSDMIDNMSHEMGTPLTSVLGYLDLLLGESPDLPQDTRDKLWVIERNARRLQNLAGNMLLLARFDADGTTSAGAPIEVLRVLERVETSLRPLADARHVRVTFGGDAAAIIEGNEGQFEQAVINVLENAVKFTAAHGTVQADVATVAGADGGSTVRIEVADTGMGIPPDEIPHLFDRFFRATNAQDHAIQGTGLGLAIVHEIVRAHHGEVTVSSVLGRGTTVQITLPARRIAPAEV